MKARTIDIRGEDAALYPTFEAWWKAHAWPGVAVAVLPKCGILVETEDGQMIAVAWLYMDNSVGVSMLEWLVTNPAASGKQLLVAIGVLIQAVKAVAKSLDYGVVITAVKQPPLVRCYERNGFTTSDSGMTHMLMLTNN